MKKLILLSILSVMASSIKAELVWVNPVGIAQAQADLQQARQLFAQAINNQGMNNLPQVLALVTNANEVFRAIRAENINNDGALVQVDVDIAAKQRAQGDLRHLIHNVGLVIFANRIDFMPAIGRFDRPVAFLNFVIELL